MEATSLKMWSLICTPTTVKWDVSETTVVRLDISLILNQQHVINSAAALPCYVKHDVNKLGILLFLFYVDIR